MKKVTNVKELRDDLITVYSELRSGEIDLKVAKELNNAAGKMISTAKLEIQYAELQLKPERKNSKIDFLEVDYK